MREAKYPPTVDPTRPANAGLAALPAVAAEIPPTVVVSEGTEAPA